MEEKLIAAKYLTLYLSSWPPRFSAIRSVVRSVFRQFVRSVVWFFGNRLAGGTREKFSAGGIRKIISVGRRDSENIFGRNFRSRAQIKVQVMTINSVQFSSKSELSSGTFGQFKVGGSQVLSSHMVQVAKYYQVIWCGSQVLSSPSTQI